MFFTKLMLAAIPEKSIEQIGEIYQRIGVQPEWTFKLMWCLTLIIAVAVVVIILRQKKIAQNQVALAKLISELLEKKP